MAIVRELTSEDQRVEGPGIWLVPGERQYGVKPECAADGLERIPFSWATEWPPLCEFIMRFPGHWKAEPGSDRWTGGEHQPEGVYWVRYDPRSLGGTL